MENLLPPVLDMDGNILPHPPVAVPLPDEDTDMDEVEFDESDEGEEEQEGHLDFSPFDLWNLENQLDPALSLSNLVQMHPRVRHNEDRRFGRNPEMNNNPNFLSATPSYPRLKKTYPKIPKPNGPTTTTGIRDNWMGGTGGGGAGSGSGSGGDDDNDPYKDICLDDIGGLEEHKKWLTNIILRPLQHPEAKQMFPPPKGILFYGPPGTGKTLLARAFGNDLSKALNKPVTFYHRKGADFLSMWFGESGSIIRKLFKDAKAAQPSIIFLDELDGVCPSREGRFVGEAYTTVVTTLLGEMDTINPGEVYVFGATNRLDAVDPAMRRPGRFDKHLEFLPPDIEARKRILQIGTRKWMSHSQPDAVALHQLAQATAGCTGADLDVLCRNVFYIAFQRHVPNASLDIGVDDLKITAQDWADALAQLKPSNSAVYGSSLYTPQPPQKKMLQLIGGTVVPDLAEKLERDLVAIAGSCGKWSDTGNPSGSAINLITSTFFITDYRRPHDESLERFVIPGVLTQDKMKVPIYRLSKEDIFNTNGNNKDMQIAKIIQQAANSLVPCILYLPRIDDIITDCSAAMPGIVEQFQDLRSKPVLILATASVGVDSIKDVGIRRIFSNASKCHLVKKPTAQERGNYFNIFSTIFTTLDGKNGGTGNVVGQKAMDKLLLAAVEATRCRSLESMERLYDRMLCVCASHVRFTDKSAAIVEMLGLIEDYAAIGE